MKNYTVFNSEGKILRYGSCPDNMLVDQASGEDEWVMEGVANDATHKVVGLNIVPKSKQELDDELFAQRKDTLPSFDPSLSDADIDKAISEYFLGRVDVARWRAEHASTLRARAYPPITDFIDAYVKITAGGEYAAEGQAQMNAHVAKCLQVKQRFTKPDETP
jgi:hypothetical protein